VSVEFGQILADNQSIVFSLALRFLRDRESAEELAQDVFLQFYKQIKQIESPDHAKWWLKRAICHRCIDESRKRKFRPRVSVESLPEPAAPASQADPMLNENLRRMLAGLSESARMVVLLRYQEDMDPSEIAEMLNIPVSTVKSQLHRSLAFLRGKLERQEVCR
jgi:RNA polymerase sigma-70 factor (ECF subfamily)